MAGFGTERRAQVDYLGRYCSSLGAQGLVVETRYVDRHYLDEYAAYYARLLRPPPSFVTRVHVFSERLSDFKLGRLFEEALRSERAAERIERELTEKYLGFISVRPVPGVPVGRTVLRPLKGSQGTRREIWAVGRHEVHLRNLVLSVEGLAFQQQDAAVGTCGSAALWSALSRVARLEGMRAPTPADIADGSGRHAASFHRGDPAGAGLTVQQVSEATRAAGFTPEKISAVGCPEKFATALHTYLLSGIPMVLVLERPDTGHAVAAAGFQLGQRVDPVLEASLPSPSARLAKLYIHDDRLGPYARAHLNPFRRTHGNDAGLALQIQDDRIPTESEQWLIGSAVVPVYPKLRLSADALEQMAVVSAEWVDEVLSPGLRASLEVEFLYCRSGDYLSRLNGRAIRRSADFLRSVELSRWCGIVRWKLRGRPVVEFVFDTTDVFRDVEDTLKLLRAVVVLDSRFRKLSRIRDLATIPTL